jgi:hypothetical protein
MTRLFCRQVIHWLANRDAALDIGAGLMALKITLSGQSFEQWLTKR